MSSSEETASLSWLLPVVIALLSMVLAGYANYSSNDKDTAQRVTKLEAHQQDDRKTLEEIKFDLAVANEKLNQVLIRLGPTKR